MTQPDAPYRDPSLSPEQRVEDLLGRMSLEDKAGLLFHDMVLIGPDATLVGEDNMIGRPATVRAVQELRMTHFNLLGSPQSVRDLVGWYNRLQEVAASTGLGIPVSLSTDPRHAFTDNAGTAALAGTFSAWPESLGFAALRDPALVEQFADTARQEYVAGGFRVALHPQVDLATEYRWARIGMTFGEDADLTADLVRAYVRGFQGERLGPDSVATMTKHFPGGGPQLDGEDPHFAYGREQVYPGGRQEYHLAPFRAALEAGTSQVMPYYGMPVGTDWEEVGFAFNRPVITGLLRQELGFDGIVCTDWGLVTDSTFAGEPMPARAWGIEELSPAERVARALEAGVDQFGGESCPELVVQLVRSGVVGEDRLDVSVRRLLREKFVLGLFDADPLDVEHALATIGREDFVAAGAAAQRASITRLTAAVDGLAALPLAEGLAVYVEGFRSEAAARLGRLVDDPADADVAVLRLAAPFEPRPGRFESMFHAGSLAFAPAERDRLLAVCAAVPTVVDLYLDRPAVVPELAGAAAALLVDYGASDDALVDVLLGRAQARGRLPFDLPSSVEAVEASRSDVPFDTADPLFRFGDGLQA
ncbi:glycoside hydrolase family 3 protein [Microlunatus capsulatus]|uniref:beta-glucosidase n=1 Tax=Microlunatus capsulatus TaxID=99117 RepID=A0ABS4ZA74_9ACTN|nr:glycoside hydrolase family 3 N-terminal domain-containing protein [Microlunatus capsulatus]MBP2417947.1 beta-glucosidase [Microlunatus capsulatus]